MAELAQQFGAYVRELRYARDWEQKDLVARMHELGDTAINTNQLSRYENGKGPLPRDKRQEIFAKALDTTADDLRAGPPKDRKPPKKSKRSKDLLGEFSAQASNGDSEKLLQVLAERVMGMGAELEGAVGLLQTLATDLKSVQDDLAILKRRKAG